MRTPTNSTGDPRNKSHDFMIDKRISKYQEELAPARTSDEILSKHQKELKKELIQMKPKIIQLQVQHNALSQKYHSGGKFAVGGRIWLGVQVAELTKGGIEPSPSLTAFDVTDNKISLICQSPQCVSESVKIDHYFGPLTTNRGIYREIEPLIEIVFHGCDVCIIAEGPSRSGKSWTMFKGNDAVVSSVAASVFTWKHTAVAGERNIALSAIQIYELLDYR